MNKTNQKIIKERRDRFAAEQKEQAAARAAFYAEPKFLFDPNPLRRAKREGRNIDHNLRSIAAETGIAVNTIRKALAGETVALSNLWKLCRFFGVDYSELFASIVPPEPAATPNSTLAAAAKKSKR